MKPRFNFLSSHIRNMIQRRISWNLFSYRDSFILRNLGTIVKEKESESTLFKTWSIQFLTLENADLATYQNSYAYA